MIIWFTGQPNSGKTTLSTILLLYLNSIGKTTNWIDGDSLRKLIKNTDYSVKGRRHNIDVAQSMAKNFALNNDYVVVSVVAPFRDQREHFKANNNVKEIYLKSSRIREGKMVDYYEPPEENFLYINTDTSNIIESLESIKKYINT